MENFRYFGRVPRQNSIIHTDDNINFEKNSLQRSGKLVTNNRKSVVKRGLKKLPESELEKGLNISFTQDMISYF